MTREEIENIPKNVNTLLDLSVTMPTRQKLYEKLNKVCELAIKALEQEPKMEGTRGDIPIQPTVPKMPKAEQETKTVIYSGDGYADGYMVYDMAECHNCGYEYEEGDKDWKEPFCPHCGQALKWESEE